jgi:putative xylitol transport system substrate-binding protein
LDLAINAALDGAYEPQSDIWQSYTDMPWNGGTDAEYSVPWTPVTVENVDALLALRN